MSRKKFSELRAQMSAESQQRAAERTTQELASMTDTPEVLRRLREIEARANAGEYHCREHFAQFDADEDVLFLLAHLALLRKQRNEAQERRDELLGKQP